MPRRAPWYGTCMMRKRADLRARSGIAAGRSVGRNGRMRNSPITTAKRAAHSADASARRTVANPWSERIARYGIATRGAIYLLIGVLAGKAALGAGGKT